MTRVQGGTAGLLSALLTGRLEQIEDEDNGLPRRRMNNADQRMLNRRDRARAKKLAARTPF